MNEELYEQSDYNISNICLLDLQVDPLIDEFSIKDGGPIPLLQMTYINKTTPKPCDKQVTLYELNGRAFNKKRDHQKGRSDPITGILEDCGLGCRRPFSVQLIPHTNLVMIVADTTCPCMDKGRRSRLIVLQKFVFNLVLLQYNDFDYNYISSYFSYLYHTRKDHLRHGK